MNNVIFSLDNFFVLYIELGGVRLLKQYYPDTQPRFLIC